jgi:hypothetical protein
MPEFTHCGHCGTAIEVPESVLAQGLEALAEFDALCAEKCREVDALEKRRDESARYWTSFWTGVPAMYLTQEIVDEFHEPYKREDSELLDRILELEAGMGHRHPRVSRQRQIERRCECCRQLVTVPEAVEMAGLDNAEKFVAARSNDCYRAAEIELRKESRAGADVALATMAQGDTTGEYGRQAMDTFRAQEEEIRKEDEELAMLRVRMAHVPYRAPVPAARPEAEATPSQAEPVAAKPIYAENIEDRHTVRDILLTMLFLIVLYILQSGSF